MRKLCFIPLIACFLLHSITSAQESGELFGKVADILETRYYEEEFREEKLPSLVRLYGPLAQQAEDLEDEIETIMCFLAHIPASHLTLLSTSTYRAMMDELKNRKNPTLGFSLVKREGKMFVQSVLDGGPADRAGLLRWDRIVEIDGKPVAESPRLDRRSDDAYLPDPPMHRIRCNGDDEIFLLVERKPGETFETALSSMEYSTFEATKAGSRVIHRKGQKLGYLHFWYIHHEGPVELLSHKMETEFRDCHGLICDLRGRGGNARTASEIISTLRKKWAPRPLVVLVDGGTRSAKEVIAYEIQKKSIGLVVGETTAGAVVPATFKKVGPELILMFPSFSLGRHTEALEFIGVRPDIPVDDSGPYSRGADPILEAGIKTLAGGIQRM